MFNSCFFKGLGIGMAAGAAAAVAVCSGMDKGSNKKSGLGRCLMAVGGIMEDLARTMGA